MKISLNNPIKPINFAGYLPVKSNLGEKEYEFYYAYNPDKYDCYLELFNVEKDMNGNYFVTGEDDGYGNIKPIKNTYSDADAIRLGEKLTKINLSKDFGITGAFAYHYKLVPKNGGDPTYALDAGVSIDDSKSTGKGHEIYNIVSENVSTTSKGGAMKLILPDNNNVLWIFDDKNNIIENPDIDKARKINKNLANKVGGSLAGIIKDLDTGKLDNFSRIITTPLFTDDDVSSHAYWNKNCFQMAHSLGNINNYITLQKKLFAKGINLVSDGAYVNEGLEGIHFKHVLKWGEKSPYFNWFRINGLQDSPLSLGVFGKKLNHVTHRVVNSKYNFEQKDNGTIKISKNHKYNSKKPTYIQIYDDRLVNAERLSDNELIKAYDKLQSNYTDINEHNDTIVPYSFAINPETLKNNIEKLSEYNKNNEIIDLKSGFGTRAIATFEHFALDGKHENGFETWDANPDIAKLNFVLSHTDTQELKNITDADKRAEKFAQLQLGTMQTQDYAVSSAKYWTQKTNQILTLNAAQHLKNLEEKSPAQILNLIKRQSTVFPKNLNITENVIKNVIKGRYELKYKNIEESYEDTILKGLMDIPLDSIELGDDITGVFASPFITKRASEENQIGKSRFEMFKNNNPHLMPIYKKAYNLTDKMYTQNMLPFAKEILTSLDKKIQKHYGNSEEYKLFDANGNTTEFGQYIIPHLTAEIAKFAVIKSVVPNAEYYTNENNGEISYNYNKLKTTSLTEIGIVNSDSPENEAISLVNRLRHKMSHITTKDKKHLTDALWQSIKDTNLNSFRLAEAIVNRNQAGLDWRIDATKDIADIESVRRGKNNFEYTWDQVISFWKKVTNSIKEYHPDAYIAAEVTDEGDIFNLGEGWNSGSRYSNVNEAVKKLINESGFTTTANYSYLSSGITKIFGNLFDFDGHSVRKGTEQDTTVMSQIKAFIDSGVPLESVIYSYTFAGNHDKCRALDGYATDMELVYADLTDSKNFKLQKRAYNILEAVPYGKKTINAEDIKRYNYNNVSGLAIAKCESIFTGMGKTIAKHIKNPERNKEIYKQILEALKNISHGSHLGRTIDAHGFGTKDYDTALEIVLDEMAYIGQKNKLSDDERNLIKNEAFKKIVDPAISKLLGHLKFLVALSGNPTLYAGDEYGSTGYETTTKNMYLQNRNIIHEEWINEEDPEYKKFIKKHKEEIDDIFKLRTRKELEPLNTGTPFVLKQQHAKTQDNEYAVVSALLRQTPNGAMTVSLFNAKGLDHIYDHHYSPKKIELNAIDLSYENGFGLKGGLKPGTKFINANNSDDIYYVNGNNEITKPENAYGKPTGPIEITDSTLILYSEPTFTGRRTLYNPQYNFVSKPYNQKSPVITGSKLAVTSK